MHIETGRLIIRDIAQGDLAGIHIWRSDPEVARWMNFEPASEIESEAWLVECITANENEPGVCICAITHRTTSDVIGWIGWGPADAKKTAAGDVDFGYAIRRDAWNRGYGTEALRAVIEHVLDDPAVGTFFGETDIENTRSARAMEKAGMEPMGVAFWDDTSLWFRARNGRDRP